MIIAIDFDGTIVEADCQTKIKPFARDAINKLYEKATIIIWTSRTGASQARAVEILKANDIHFHEINKPVKANKIYDPRKIVYDILIDDKSVFFIDDWKLIYNNIIKQL